VTVTYPQGTPYKKSVFEDSVRAILSAQGDLFAWQKLMATEAGAFRMVAEFCDCSNAELAVKRLNGKTLALASGATVLVSVGMHTPDLSPASSSPTRASTPTRQQPRGELAGSMDDVFGRMDLNTNPTQGRSNTAGPNPPQGTGSSGHPFMAANPGIFGHSYGLPASANAVPLLMGSAYGNGYGYSADMLGQFGGFNPSSAQNMGAFFNNTTAMVPPGFNFGGPNAGLTNMGYGQYGSNFQRQQHYPGQIHGQYQNTDRQIAVRNNCRHMVRGRHYQNPGNAAGHHNHVEIERITEGIDVRTTVRHPRSSA
jgi:hypothetical protein